MRHPTFILLVRQNNKFLPNTSFLNPSCHHNSRAFTVWHSNSCLFIGLYADVSRNTKIFYYQTKVNFYFDSTKIAQAHVRYVISPHVRVLYICLLFNNYKIVLIFYVPNDNIYFFCKNEAIG